MCWNKEVSIITFIVVIVLVIILYKRNIGSDRHLAILSAVFVTIQLMEFFIWLSLENKGSDVARKVNHIATRMILILLWAQPLVNMYMAGTTGIPQQTEIGTVVLWSGLVIFGALFIYSIVLASRGRFKTTTGPNCHLVWQRSNTGRSYKRNGDKRHVGLDARFVGSNNLITGLYLAGLLIPLMFVRPISKSVTLIGLGLILLFTSRMLSSKSESSSWWCWIAFIFVLAAVMLPAHFPQSKNDATEDTRSRDV